MSWVAVAGIAVGAGTAIYGANKQKQNQQDANAANQASIANADQSAWNAYLMQRGINGGGNVPFGQIPTNPQIVNSKLPLWANVRMNPAAVTARTAGTPMSTTNQPRRATGFKNGQLIFS
jgi:hypothetical protein